MSRLIRLPLVISLVFLTLSFAQPDTVWTSELEKYPVYPSMMNEKPDLPSPFVTETGGEYILAFTRFSKFALIPVTLSNERDVSPQLYVDTLDFPLLARTGLHDAKLLNSLSRITGWDLDTITALGRPGNLSEDGFMAEDEDIQSVLLRDNMLVSAMGLTHADLARPLFHLLNMMEWDLDLGRWNRAKHKWEHIVFFFYNGRRIYVDAEDTKGGQRSIFNDGIEGAFHIRLERPAAPEELALLARNYHYLPTDKYEELKNALFTLTTGEMEPQYIMRYGFYEGHTYWRADPIAIALIFGLKDLPELEAIFSGKLYDVLTGHAVAQP